ncbi:MAG: ATP-binding cassette domain-containing protein [Cyclobacteriaceae bacterium]
MNAFEIRDLVCAYADGQTVLEVPNLDIEFGKIVVFLGPSGVGKSTLLETLGLMNFTIKTGTIISAFCKTDFKSLWEKDHDISKVRNAHMSFVFQENNFLENISAKENAMIPLLIQGRTTREASEIINSWFKELDLEFISGNTKVTELSVGQKQRLSFIRAASPAFTVLFGDEPTGNLDRKNGAVLMDALRAKIASDPSTMLSIIVSHDIDLAIRYADQIVVLTKNATRKGQIKPEHIYDKSGLWRSSSGHSYKEVDFRKHISDLF